MYLRLFLLVFFTSIIVLLKAQPKNHIGCKHSHAHAQRAPLTQLQKAMIQASAERSDTIDIVDYTINLEVTDFSNKTIFADCLVSFTSKMDGINHINLDLQDLTIDSIFMDGNLIEFDYDSLLLHIPFENTMSTGDQAFVHVFYHGTPAIDPSAGRFGGFDFLNGYAYNLGIGISSNPPNFGRSWHPCFDSFVERATYELNVTSRLPNRAYCVGSFIEEIELEDNLVRRTYQMGQQIPTYLCSVAISNYVESNGMHQGVGGMLPTQLVAQPNDINAMTNTFVDLGQAIDALEFWYGSYAWERVGYVATPVGAMEHPTNIAYPISIATGGNSFGHRRLMAHELAHCWWGDVVTVGHARDMWVKEGNAEYGAHLMTEFALGREAFIDQVKDNHLEEVLIAAHIDDEGFHPLSNIPFPYIYGTHTYRKGAAMLHNMRGYLGDSLFRVGQRAVLDAFRFASADAYQYRDKVTEATGYDMTSFFDDWIFNPGFSAFEADYSYSYNGTLYSVDLNLVQKTREAPELHTNVPLEITFTDAVGNKDTQRVMASSELTNMTLSSSVEPVWVTVNENNTLNMAHLSHQTTFEEEGNLNLPYVEMTLNINEIPTPTTIHVDHYWVAPDPIQNNPEDAQISSTHYWRVLGDFDNGIDIKGSFEYRKFLDADLTGETEEDLILVYRPNKTYDWEEYPYYNKLAIIPTDGNGFIQLQEILQGEYAFANGTLPVYTATEETDIVENNIQLFPNPTSSQVRLTQNYSQYIDVIQIELINLKGQIVQKENLHLNFDQLEHQLSVDALPAGTYWVKLMDKNAVLLGAKQVEVVH